MKTVKLTFFAAVLLQIWGAHLFAQTLVMVHPSYAFSSPSSALKKQGSETVQPAAEELVNHFLSKNKNVYVLISNLDHTYFDYLSQLKKTKLVHSEGGEHQLKFKDRHIYMGGGMLYACFRRALEDLIELNAQSPEPLYIHLVEPAIYSKHLNSQSTQAIEEKFKDFINELTDHGKRQQFFKSKIYIDVVTNTTPLH